MTFHNLALEIVVRSLFNSAAAVAVAVVGVAGLAVAAMMNTHEMDVRLPDGSLAHVRYVGDMPPSVNFASGPMAISMLSPDSDLLASDSPFGTLARISRTMDLEAAAMLREADDGTPPVGGRGFSMVSTISGSGVCTRSVEYRSFGDGRPPRIVTHTSGGCASEEKRPAPSAAPGAITAVSNTAHAGPRSI